VTSDGNFKLGDYLAINPSETLSFFLIKIVFSGSTESMSEVTRFHGALFCFTTLYQLLSLRNAEFNMVVLDIYTVYTPRVSSVTSLHVSALLGHYQVN
jgi:hypothetical protein